MRAPSSPRQKNRSSRLKNTHPCQVRLLPFTISIPAFSAGSSHLQCSHTTRSRQETKQGLLAQRSRSRTGLGGGGSVGSWQSRMTLPSSKCSFGHPFGGPPLASTQFHRCGAWSPTAYAAQGAGLPKSIKESTVAPHVDACDGRSGTAFAGAYTWSFRGQSESALRGRSCTVPTRRHLFPYKVHGKPGARRPTSLWSESAACRGHAEDRRRRLPRSRKQFGV